MPGEVKVIEVVQSFDSYPAEVSIPRAECLYGVFQKRKEEPPFSLILYSSTVGEPMRGAVPAMGYCHHRRCRRRRRRYRYRCRHQHQHQHQHQHEHQHQHQHQHLHQHQHQHQHRHRLHH